MDNLKVHKVPEVTQWLAGHRAKIEVFYLPPYSPELNPNELLNADLKQAIGKQAPKRRKGGIEESGDGPSAQARQAARTRLAILPHASCRLCRLTQIEVNKSRPDQ